MTTTYNYGDSIVEFFPFNQDEFQSVVQKLEDNYMHTTESFDNFKGEVAANIRIHGLPIRLAIPQILELHDRGCTMRTDRYCGTDAIGNLDVIFQKPSAEIQEEISAMHAVALEQYEADRYKRNSDETERQLQITLDRIQREEDARAEAAKAKALEKAKAQALKDLREAYAE